MPVPPGLVLPASGGRHAIAGSGVGSAGADDRLKPALKSDAVDRAAYSRSLSIGCWSS